MNLKNFALYQTQSYVNGQWIDSESNDTFEVVNPYNGKESIRCGKLQWKRCLNWQLKAASEAFKIWKKNLRLESDQKILKNWYQLQVDNADDLARLLND